MKARQQLTAIIYDKRGRVLARATNSYTQTHPRQVEYARRAGKPKREYLHAEIAAIIRCRDKINKAHKIRVERYGKDGEPRLAKPCEVCVLAIQEVGISEIEYTIG